MTLQQLRCFAAVAQTMSFAQAAKTLYISQPAVSHHIRALENELGVELVERSLHHVALTPAGERFYLQTTNILAHLDAAVTQLRGSDSMPETLHIGFESTIQIPGLRDILRAYRKACPDVGICSIELTWGNYRQFFRDGRVDVMFVSDIASTLPEAAFLPLHEGFFCCVMPPEHPLAGCERVRLTDLKNETFILLDDPNCTGKMDALQREIRIRCLSATLCYSTSSLYSIPMIEAGLGVAVMPSYVVPESGKVVKVPLDTGESMAYGIAWRRSDTSEKVRKFVQAARSRNLLQGKSASRDAGASAM